MSHSNVLLWRLRTIFAASSARFILIGFDTHILIEELRASNRGNNCENAKLGTSKNTTNIIESFLWHILLLNIYHALLDIYGCNKITTTWIQISRQNLKGFFSNATHHILEKNKPY